MEIKNKRLTKSMIEQAEQRRAVMFDGLTEREIRNLVPVNKGYLYEYQNERASSWGICVDECVLCGEQHKHGKGGTGEYSIHCEDKGETYPFKYNIQLDTTDADNIRLIEKYGVK